MWWPGKREIRWHSQGLPQCHQFGQFRVGQFGQFGAVAPAEYGVREFFAIINPPEAAILAVGAIKEVPVVEQGRIVPGKVMRMTLSVDHRVFYGATAAQFMAEVKRLIENPVTLLVPQTQ